MALHQGNGYMPSLHRKARQGVRMKTLAIALGTIAFILLALAVTGNDAGTVTEIGLLK